MIAAALGAAAIVLVTSSLAAGGGGVAGAGAGTGLRVGVNCGRDGRTDPFQCAVAGAAFARVEFPIGASVASIEPLMRAYVARGIEVQPLAGFHGRVPTTDEARNLRLWALRFGPRGSFWRDHRNRRHLAIRHIEFGNETGYGHQYGDDHTKASYAQRAREYALRARDAAVALAGTGVRLLVQADGPRAGIPIWIDQMFAAVPDLGRWVAAWTVHPYGPAGTSKIDAALAALSRATGGSVRIAVTEWGLSSDNGRQLSDNYGYPSNLTYEAAAELLRNVVHDWTTRYGSQLAQVIVYQHADQRLPGVSTNREHYFGILRRDGRWKGAYTAAVRDLLGVSDGTAQSTRAPR